MYYLFLNDSLYEMNCYNKCEYYYYFDESNKYKCTTQENCPNNYKLIISKKKCIDKYENDNNYKYEYNLTCYINCPETTINGENTYICYEIENKEITTSILSKTENAEKILMSSYIDFNTYNNEITNEITYKNIDIASQTNVEIEREDETNIFEKIRKKLIKRRLYN